MTELAIEPDDALVVVDVQHDFLPGGALAVAEGERIFAPINALLPRFTRVYATRDWHPPDHSSFTQHGGPWPVHCVAGSHGAALDERLDDSQIERIVDKGVDRKTDGYSGFAATDLALDLRAHGVRRIFVCGLATDYCVKSKLVVAILAAAHERYVHALDVQSPDRPVHYVVRAWRKSKEQEELPSMVGAGTQPSAEERQWGRVTSMYGIVRQYKTHPGQIDEIVRRSRDRFMPLISKAMGFVAWSLVDAGSAGVVTTSVFEDEMGADLAAGWVKENQTALALVRHKSIVRRSRFVT